MKLDKIDQNRIYDNQPSYLRLYNINDVTEDERKYLEYLPMFVEKIFISSKDENLIHKIELQYPHLLHKVIEEDGTIKFLGRRNNLIVDLDITSKCNLTCENCSRFSNLSSTWVEMGMEQVNRFIHDNYQYGKKLTVKVIGGEPTIHPHIDSILSLLHSFFHVVLVTNGVKSAHGYVPPVDICVENSAKWVGINPEFWATCDAPKDDPRFDGEDYGMGCDNSVACRNGYTVDGYYPCTIMGSIDRMLHEPGGPLEGTDMLSQPSLAGAITRENKAYTFNTLCQYCGFYKRMGFKEAYGTDFERTTKQFYSKSWEFMNGRK